MSRMAIAALLVVLSFSPIFGDGDNSAVANAIKNYLPAIVWVKYLEPYEDWDGSIQLYEAMTIGVVDTKDGRVAMRGHIHVRDKVPRGFRVVLPDGAELPADYLGKATEVNIAYARVKAGDRKLQHIEFKPNTEPQLGNEVFILSRRSIRDSHTPTVLKGHISTVLDGARKSYLLSIAGGENHAGAPVFNSAGEPIGIAGYDLSLFDGGPPFARPDTLLLYTNTQLASAVPIPPSAVSEYSSHSWAGMLFMNINESLARSLGLGEKLAVYVSVVVPCSPADTAGIQPLDIITACDGKPLTGDRARLAENLSAQIERTKEGTQLAFEIIRSNKSVTASVLLVSKPIDMNTAPRVDFDELGLSVRPATWDYYVYRNMKSSIRGVVIDRVVSGSPADLCGLEPEDLVVRLGDFQISGLDSFNKALESFAGMQLLEVHRGVRRHFLKLETFKMSGDK